MPDVGPAMKRRDFLHLSVASAAFAAAPHFAFADSYPSHAVRLIVGFPPGGPTDVYARLIAEWLSNRLGQPFVVENRPGAGSTIGIEAVVTSPPDGYTLLLISSSAPISMSYYKKLNFDLIRDIAAVGGIAFVPMVMVVHPSVPATTVPEFIAYAKANPGKLNMASAGTGNPQHVSGELFKLMAGVDLLHVPYRGAAPALTDLLGGRAQIMFESVTTLMPYIQAGKLRALAVTTPKRSLLLPDIPSIAEFLPGYNANTWFGIAAPKQTPAEIVDLLNKEINAGLKDPTISKQLAELGTTPLAGTPADFERIFINDTEKWAKLIKAANIQQE